MLGPVFIKAHLTFSLDNQTFDFVNRTISLFGCSSLSVPKGNLAEIVGKTTIVTIKIPSNPPDVIQTKALIMAERSINSVGIGLKFQLEAEESIKLSTHIAAHGFYPTEYVRKYPRIPSTAAIQTFPLRTTVVPLGSNDEATSVHIFDVANLSPNGVLITSESSLTELEPGKRISMVLEPRGWFPVQVEIEGLVCRITEDLNLENGNIIKYVGVKFIKINEENRIAFMDLLKDILQKVKSKA